MAESVVGVRLSQTSPAFLNANSTSHTWPFSAIAELIDNAYDPDVSASQLYIDIEQRHSVKILVFMDNGNGMTQEKLYKMLSFGYCEKVEIGGHKPVGHYGNGFKSGSMRLGKDVIVFTKSLETQSVGLLSQTYLDNIGATTVLVPMVSWSKKKKIIDDLSSADSLQAITNNSIFNSEQELLNEFNELGIYTTGTRIIIYNLKTMKDGKLELDLESNSNDIRNPETQELDFSTTLRPVMEYVPEYWKSLRDYCSILFLKPRMKIILRGNKVKTKLISKSLSRTEKDYYKPRYLPKPVKIIFGFSDSMEDYGLMLYHRNRLIKAFKHVGCQTKPNDHGVGVVGVVEVDFLEPVHNKQDFNNTARYNAAINALGQKLNDYWNTKTQNGGSSVTDERRKADWTWVQCENCLQWRRLPDGFTDEGLPDKWYCYMNPDPVHNRCDMEEEPEDEDELQAMVPYSKVKKKVEPRRTGEMVQRELAIAEKEKELLTMQQNIHQSLEPLAPPGTQGCPTIADLEAAQKELQLAKRREQHQREVIESLQRNRKQIQNGQNQMRQNMMSLNPNNINVLNNIAKSGQSQKQITQNGNKRKERITLPGGDAIVTRNTMSGSDSSDNENDMPPAKKKQLIVKLPQHKKNKNEKDSSAGVIVIDSDDDNDANKEQMETDDVKPDVKELDQLIANTENADDKGSVEKLNKSKSVACKSSKSTDDGHSKVTPVKPGTSKSPAKDGQNKTKTKKTAFTNNRVHQHTQTLPNDVINAAGGLNMDVAPPGGDVDHKITSELLQTQFEESKAKLMGLRNNVGKLLQTILPDLQIDHLEYIDAIVREMVRVNGDDNTKNGETPNGQPSVDNVPLPEKEIKKESEF